MCKIQVAGVPGPIYRGLLLGLAQFLKILVFLGFVFIVVLTFGEVYKISSTNQMLATLAGGFLPVIMREFMQPDRPDIEIGTVSFKSKLDEVIKNFWQYWPLYDFQFQVVPSAEDMVSIEMRELNAERNDSVGEMSENQNSNNNVKPADEASKSCCQQAPQNDKSSSGLANSVLSESGNITNEGESSIAGSASQSSKPKMDYPDSHEARYCKNIYRSKDSRKSIRNSLLGNFQQLFQRSAVIAEPAVESLREKLSVDLLVLLPQQWFNVNDTLVARTKQ